MHKVEIDISKQNQIAQATEFIKRYKCPAIVIPPDLFTNTNIVRSVAMSPHKIITTVDWPKGTQFLSDKFRGMASSAIHADGFEILLTPSGKIPTTKEIRFLSEFFADHFPPTVEMRFVLGWFAPNRTEDQIKHMIEACKSIPTPSMIRTTHLTKLAVTQGSLESHKRVIAEAISTKKTPLKISGNIDFGVRVGCQEVTRFGCTLQQAIDLQRDLANGGPKKNDEAGEIEAGAEAQPDTADTI